MKRSLGEGLDLEIQFFRLYQDNPIRGYRDRGGRVHVKEVFDDDSKQERFAYAFHRPKRS